MDLGVENGTNQNVDFVKTHYWPIVHRFVTKQNTADDIRQSDRNRAPMLQHRRPKSLQLCFLALLSLLCAKCDQIVVQSGVNQNVNIGDLRSKMAELLR